MTKKENSNDDNEMKLQNGSCPVCTARSIFDSVGFILFYPVVASLVAAAIAGIWFANRNVRDIAPPNTPIELVTQEPTALKRFNGGAGPF